MRNRLVERLTKSKKGSLGYTMTELLVVIGIIAVLCAIAIPGIIYIRNSLRFAQANNYAKSIFLAAQQNLTELRSDGGLGPVQDASNELIPLQVTDFPNEFRGEYYYTTTGTEAFSRVLPAGSIDADIRDDQIVIEYNPITGNVYSVFYFEQGIVSSGFNLAVQYSGGALPREKESRRDLMVGYYDGSGLNSSQIELEQTQAMVEFINGQEGMIQVKVPMPESFYGDFSSFAQALDVDLTITGEYSITKAAELNLGVVPMTLRIKSAGNMTGCRLDPDGKTVIIEYAIDSLANRSSFANYISDTQKARPGEEVGTDKSLTTLLDETEFHYTVLPGENITIQADVSFQGTGQELVQIDPGILSGVNPMFESLQPGTTEGRYVLTISNGRNLQNLNAISPTIAKMIEVVSFTDDIYWNDTVSYYNDAYGSGNNYRNAIRILVDGVEKDVYDEAPARALPYFVPIHNEDLFGTARFIFPGQNDAGVNEDGGLGDYIWDRIKDWGEGVIKDFGIPLSNEIPFLTDELDLVGRQHATIQGNGHKVVNLRIDSTKYQVPNVGVTKLMAVEGQQDPITVDCTGTFYATGDNQIVDYHFTGLFGYVNTPISDLHVVNPIIKGYYLEHTAKQVPTYIDLGLITIPGRPKTIVTYNNPATGALVGASGYNTWITDCSTYIDKNAPGYMNLVWGPEKYSKTADQNWYGVMGEGAVGGLVGYAKSHLNTTGEINGQEVALAFSDCFAAVPVSGNMRGNDEKQFGYSNGVGAFIGNSQLTNFYNCYASGDVLANGCAVYSTQLRSLFDWTDVFGVKLDLLYSGRFSMGAGGFVGSSHGTRYTNCFATGNVDATVSSDSKHTRGGGGFVGFMSIDETFNYGHAADEYSNIAQRTVFTNCYSVGQASTNDSVYENFSGANGRIALNLNQSTTYVVGDYFRLYAPYYCNNNKAAPGFESIYIYRDSYFLSNYHTQSGQDNSSSCASPDVYATFENLPGVHEKNSAWVTSEINEIKNIVLAEKSILNWTEDTYQTEYFSPNPELEGIYKNLYDVGFSATDWNSATASTTHPYSLSAGLRYPFSKLVGLDYYGDWPSKPSDVGMAYYETYEDTGNTHYFFDRSHTDNAALTLREGDDVLVSKDGYAIFSANNTKLTVTVTNGNSTISDTLTVTGESQSVSNSVYHVFLLSDKLMKALPADGEFYVKVTAKHEDSSDSYTMYFNPNVALSHINPVEGRKNADKPDAAPSTIYIRSARQFKGIETLSSFWGENYRYNQQLNIDANEYDWNNKSADVKLTSIGTAAKPFHADYAAAYSTESNGTAREQQYKISGFQIPASGMFGCIGEKGSVSDLIVDCTEVNGVDNLDSAGILAGVNNGTLDNITLNLKKDVTLSAKTNAGLLAGLSGGTVSNCTVTAEEDVKLNAVNAGALIGSASGTADRRTAVTDCVLTLDENLKIESATYAGGLIGEAKFATVTNSTVSIKKLDSQAEYAGGLIGSAEDSFLTGSSGDNVIEVAISDALSAKGTAAGVLASGKNTPLSGIDLSAKSISGNIAAGFLGTGDNVDPTNCTVRISRNIEGQTGAAGAACTIGSGSVFNRIRVDLTKAKVSASAGNAAGFALEIKPEAIAMGQSSVTLNDTEIKASANAAGFACIVEGSAGDVRVVGKGEITGANAAGFACTITGAVETAHVSPALNNDDYRGNRNRNLIVEGSDSAAGFVLTVGEKGVVNSCYTLCKVESSGEIQIEKDAKTAESSAPTEPEMESVSSTYGFVGTNNGTINRCMANVDLTEGFAFAGINNKLITSCYGWYGDQTDRSPTKVRAEMVHNGICNSSYFVEIDPMERAGQCATVYHADGTIEQMTSSMLQNVQLTGFVTGYNEYPYSDMYPTDYPYPMLRDHYGDWLLPPQYAYGVAYYETYADGTTKLHMVDLSDQRMTEEYRHGITVSRHDTFDNSGTITGTGYAMFYNTAVGLSEEGKLFSVNVADGYDYNFYAITDEGETTIPATIGNSLSAVVNTWFADAINVTDNYQIRTPEQLANIGNLSANYVQTHNIATTDVTTATIAQGKTYNGNGLTLRITGQTSTWLSDVSGTVQNLNLAVTDAVNKPIFGTVSGTVNLNAVNLGSIAQGGALVSTATGSINTGSITVGAMNGYLFDTITGATVTTGEINLASRTASMVRSFLSGTLQGDSQNMKSISLAADAQTPLFSANVGGTVRNYSYSTGTVLGGLADTVDGELSSLTVTANDTAAAFVTELNGTMSNVALNVAGIMNASAITTNNAELSNVTLTSESATVSGGALVGSNAGSITGCTVDVNTVNAQGAVFGVVADRLDPEKTLTATVLVDDLIYSAQADARVGGLVGTNAGTVTGSTVTILAVEPAAVEEPEEEITEPIEEDPTDPTEETVEEQPDPTEETGETQPAEPIAEELPQGVKLSGVKDFTLTFGGLTGTNSGAIESSKANVSITYVQPTENTDQAILGGLVGTMQGGTLTGTNASDATGSITLTGNAKGRAYVVGGAVGSDLGATYTNVAVTTLIGENWAGASVLPNAENPMATGPIGMFTGYVTTGNYNTCASTAPNSTYQFLGQVQVSYGTLPALSEGFQAWFVHASADNQIQDDPAGLSLEQYGRANGFAAYNAANVYYTTEAVVNGCTFVYGDANYTVIIKTEYFFRGMRDHFPEGYRLHELRSEQPNDNTSRTYVITNTAGNVVFKQLKNGTALSAPDVKNDYYSVTEYNNFTRWTIEKDGNKHYWKNNNGHYLWLYLLRDTTRTGRTQNIVPKWEGSNYSLYGFSGSLGYEDGEFTVKAARSGRVRLWYFEHISEFFRYNFAQYQGLYNDIFVVLDATGKPVDLLSPASAKTDLPVVSWEDSKVAEDVKKH